MSMKILYLDCGMGASGDMLMGALASLLDAPDAFERQMNALGLEHVSVSMEKSVKCGVVMPITIITAIPIMSITGTIITTIPAWAIFAG